MSRTQQLLLVAGCAVLFVLEAPRAFHVLTADLDRMSVAPPVLAAASDGAREASHAQQIEGRAAREQEAMAVLAAGILASR